MSAMSDGGSVDSFVGQGLARPNAKRLIHGKGRYTDDVSVPRMLHLAFVRSPFAHAEIGAIDGSDAEAIPGVVAVVTGNQVAEVCDPFLAIAAHRPGHKSAPQHALAVGKATYQGEAVAAVIATSREIAEDAAELVMVDWADLPAVTDMEDALAGDSPVIHGELGDNLAFQHSIDVGDAAAGIAAAPVVIEHAFEFGRHTTVTLEPRTILADYDPVEDRLTVHQSHQSPYQMQDVFSRHLGIEENRVRVICPDIGGGFGLKINVHAEEVAVAAISKLLGRPVKYVADRLESFAADCQTREHRATAKLAVDAEGHIAGFEFDNVMATGAYTAYIRFGLAEGMMAVMCAGGPYRVADYSARTRVAYVNKGIVGMFRGVGIPIGVAVTEQMMDFAAHEAGIDPVEFRRRNYHRDDDYPLTTAGGYRVKRMSLHQCLDALVNMMDYDALRAEQATMQKQGVYRGIGVATFIEATAYGPAYYGPSGARVSTQDGCTVKLEPSGKVRCITSITDQGQGTLTGLGQIVADNLGVAFDDIEMVSGDSSVTPYGGGAWASRGMVVGGEAALQAARALKANVLDIAASILQADASTLEISGGEIRNASDGEVRMAVSELARVAYFRQDTLSPDKQPELMVTRHHATNDTPYYIANGVQAVHLELDPETGFVKLLDWWIADDCGRVINPLMVDEQLRGGIIQGIGNALFEHLQYDENGQIMNGTLADYLLPMATEMPDIEIAHVSNPLETTELGANGVGEAGTIGAIAGLWCGVNDALRPFGARAWKQPLSPDHILEVIEKARG